MTALLQPSSLPGDHGASKALFRVLRSAFPCRGHQRVSHDGGPLRRRALVAAMSSPDRPEVLVTARTSEQATELQQRLAEVGLMAMLHAV